MSKMINGVHHIAVKPTAEQYDRTVYLYTELLGMEVTTKWGDERYPCMMLSCGDGTCMEILKADNEFPDEGVFAHVAFWADKDKIEDVIESVRKEGFEVTGEPHEGILAGKPIKNAFFIGAAKEKIELFWE